MNFRTRIDFTDRQAKQYEKTGISLSGASTFGLPYSALTTGPDLTMSAITYENVVLQSTYSGNTGTTVYTFGDSRMSIDEGDLVTLTPSNSGNTQYAGPTWAGFDMFTTVDGYTGWTGYSAVTYDLNVVTMEDLGSGAYSGVVQSDFIVYSATSVDWTGSTTWVNVRGITKTDDLIIDGLVSTDPIATDADGKIVAGASDMRLKRNIEILSDGLDKIRKLRGVEFEWTPESNMGIGKRFGLIAQEVNEVIPEMVRARSKSDGMLTINYNEFIPWIIEAIKELGSGLESTNSEVKSKIKVDEFGRWIVTPALSSKHLILPEFTPISTNDERGMLGDVVWDDTYIYVKRNNGWGRSKFENF